jgi:hypothetical protein
MMITVAAATPPPTTKHTVVKEIQLAQDKDQWRALMNTVIKKHWEGGFLTYASFFSFSLP